MSYDKETAERARSTYRFIVAGGKNKNSLRYSSNIERYLAKAPEVIYNFDWRITGTEEAIRNTLKEAKYSDEDIEDAVSGPGVLSFADLDNPNKNPEILARLDGEIKEGKVKIEKKEYKSSIRLEDLELIGKNISKISIVVDNEKGGKKVEVKKKLTLKEFVEKCRSDGKVADVSLLTSDGKKRKCANIPVNSRDKVHLQELGLLVATEAKLSLALRLLGVTGEGKETALTFFREQKEKLNNSETKKPAEKKTAVEKKAPAEKVADNPVRAKVAAKPKEEAPKAEAPKKALPAKKKLVVKDARPSEIAPGAGKAVAAKVPNKTAVSVGKPASPTKPSIGKARPLKK